MSSVSAAPASRQSTSARNAAGRSRSPACSASHSRSSTTAISSAARRRDRAVCSRNRPGSLAATAISPTTKPPATSGWSPASATGNPAGPGPDPPAVHVAVHRGRPVQVDRPGGRPERDPGLVQIADPGHHRQAERVVADPRDAGAVGAGGGLDQVRRPVQVAALSVAFARIWTHSRLLCLRRRRSRGASVRLPGRPRPMRAQAERSSGCCAARSSPLRYPRLRDEGRPGGDRMSTSICNWLSRLGLVDGTRQRLRAGSSAGQGLDRGQFGAFGREAVA